ncbi:hypothetical protein D3C86_1607840 [compost metagenome]
MAEHATLPMRLESPGKADGACGNTVDILRTKNPGCGDGDIGSAVSQGAHRHLPGDLHTRQVEGFDGARADVQNTLLGLR